MASSRKPAPKKAAPAPPPVAVAEPPKAASKPTGSRSREVRVAEQQAAVAAVKDLTIESITADLAQTQAAHQARISALSTELVEKVNVLSNAKLAIAAMEQRLKDLHAIEAASISLEDLKAAFESEKASQAAQRSEWEAEWASEEENRQQQWDRAEADHAYDTKREHKRIEDEFQQKLDDRKRAEALRIAEFDRDLKTRQDAISAQEKTIADMQKRFDGLETEIKNAVKTAEAIKENSLNREHKHTLALLQAEQEKKEALLGSELKARDTTIVQLTAQVESLRTQVESAHAREAATTKAALDAQSGRAVAEALQRRDETQAASGNNKR